MLSHDGRYVLTYNGEIYNYRELREQLRSLGHQFRTGTDAEVLLAAITEWGWDAMDHLNGMFAFAVWDNKERTLTLARDHVGIKPLYYTHIPGNNDAPPSFAFGSEIKAILATKLIKPALNPEALHQFLTFLWSPDPNTLFKTSRLSQRATCFTSARTTSNSNNGGTFRSITSKKVATKRGGANAHSKHSIVS
jgi:asparagine synthase (glutamine-hydrolysing)